MNRKFWIYAIIVVILSLVVFFAFFYRGRVEEKKLCQGVEIRIEVPQGATQYLDEKILRERLKQMNFRLEGVPIDSISTYKIEKRLRQDQTFSNAQVFFSQSTNRLVVRILQRVPLFLVEPQGGVPYYVNEDRSTHPVSVGIASYVPLISGYVREQEATTSLYDMMNIIKSSQYFQNYFAHIYINKAQQLILTPRIGRTLVYFGLLKDVEAKLHKLEVFNKQVVSKKGWDAFSYVKLSFHDQVVAKERYPKPEQVEEDTEPTAID